jgi:DNA-binding transcriptional LysR family regulator
MQDLNDLFFFTQVVANSGFAPAGRALNEPKSKLSRRVAQLEARLGVRLIERSSRRFRVTEVGQTFYERCRSILAEVEQAEAVVAEAQGEPRGMVRLSCPTGLLDASLSQALLDFMARHSQVKLRVIATNRRIDLIEERMDVALRVRETLDTDAAFTVHPLGHSRRILVASPELAQRLGALLDLSELAAAPTLTMAEQVDQDRWELVGPEGQTRSLLVTPRLGSSDFGTLRDAAVAGLGVALLPTHVCHAALQAGRLVRLLPDWHAPDGLIHLMFTARRGLPPAVRALIDHVSERFREKALWAGVGDT